MNDKALVIAEHDGTRLARSTRSTIQCARALGIEVDVLLAAHEEHLAKEIAELEGVHAVQLILHACFEHTLAENLTPIIVEMASNYSHILAPSTTFGKNVLPRVAALLDVAQISDACQVIDTHTYVRPIYAGNAFETVQSSDRIQVISVRTTAFEPVQKQSSAAPIHILDLNIQVSEKIQYMSSKTPELTRPELTVANIVVSGGRGLKNIENFKMIEKLADKLGAAVGASRAAVDAGLVPNDFQVGQTGKIVAPTLYIAIGISGAIQHLAGMKDSKVIVAINKDSEAPIFQVADYGLVGDLFQILPELLSALSQPQ